MKITVRRGADNPHSVPSSVWINDKFECYGLEPARVNPVIEGHPCILAGTFTVSRSLSPHLHYLTPILLNVPNRSEIRIHIANFPRDLEGCLGLGTVAKTDEVDNSRVAFDAFMVKFNAAWDAKEEITITYIDLVAQ